MPRMGRLFQIIVVTLLGAFALGCKDPSPNKAKSDASQRSSAQQAQQQTLAEARRGFVTELRPSEYKPDPPVPDPPKGLYEKIRYTSPAGELVAVVTPDPKDGDRRPAVLWCHGGFGGIGDYYWSPQPATNDQTPKAFLDAGFVVMLPTWRGENENPGRFEMFLGEADDALAALDHLRALPHVDPARVYVVGHSSGGTIALLLAQLAGPEKVRAAFSFGGVLDARSMRNGWEPMIPFDPSDDREMSLRSPADFVASLRVPTWYVEGDLAAAGEEMPRLATAAREAGVPLTVITVRAGDHFDILRPLTKLLAERLSRDTGPTLALDLDAEAVQAAFEAEHAARLSKRRAMPYVTLKPAAVAEIKRLLAAEGLPPRRTWLTVDGGKLDLSEQFDPNAQIELEQDGVRIAFWKDAAERTRGLTIDFIDQDGSRGFSFGRAGDDEE